MPAIFDPLNNRKVGNTYGERSQNKGVNNERSIGTWERTKERAKDLFLGGKKPKDIRSFSNTTDRYEGVKKNHYMTRVQQGNTHQQGVQKPPSDKYDKYIGYLDRLISLLDTKKKVV